jgi:hypothetical protein
MKKIYFGIICALLPLFVWFVLVAYMNYGVDFHSYMLDLKGTFESLVSNCQVDSNGFITSFTNDLTSLRNDLSTSTVNMITSFTSIKDLASFFVAIGEFFIMCGQFFKMCFGSGFYLIKMLCEFLTLVFRLVFVFFDFLLNPHFIQMNNWAIFQTK